MSVTGAVKTTTDLFGPRFFFINYMPTFTAGAFLLLLVWAGAPGPLRFSAAWRMIGALSLGPVVLGMLALTVVAMLLHPLQLPIVRLLEGYWPRWLAWPRRYGCWRQRRRRDRIARVAVLPATEDPEALQRSGQQGARLRTLFPSAPGGLLPTALGNALAAAESRAGREYGFDGVVAWPRLYPVLAQETRSIVDDRRNVLDGLARFAITGLVTGIAAGVLLAGSGAWLLLALIPLTAAWIAYRGAVHAAIAYGEVLRVAFDLHRFELLRQLHLPLPIDQARERETNASLCTMWRQAPDDPALWRAYEHPQPE